MAQCAQFTPTWPDRVRFTALDGCGRPLYGPCSTFVTDGFGQIAFATQIQEGETFEAPKANGGSCVSIKMPDTVQYDTITIDLCQVDPTLLATLNDKFRILRDYLGNVSGWAEGYDLNSTNRIAIEIWLNVAASTIDICENPDAQVEGQWVHIVSPMTGNWRRGDITMGREFNAWQIVGTSFRGSRWGRGPYPVELNGPGAAGPLVDPVLPGDRITTRVVTVPPPDLTCGCTPLSNPNAPALNIAEDTSDTTRMTAIATADLPDGTTYMIDWGDGSTPQPMTGGTATHHYTLPGEYWVSIVDQANGQMYRAVKVTVPFVMTLAATPASGPAPLEVTATTSGEQAQPVTFDWGV